MTAIVSNDLPHRQTFADQSDGRKALSESEVTQNFWLGSFTGTA